VDAPHELLIGLASLHAEPVPLAQHGPPLALAPLLEVGCRRDPHEVSDDARVVAAPPGEPAGAGTDLVHALEQVATGHSLSGPGHPVTLPAPVVAELAAAVSECLRNVVHHVGQHARAWVLVEELGDEVVVTVRDDGPGIAADRLDDAAAEGRMGVSGSIIGRLRDLGGRAELTTGPTIGTEWELHVPRTATAQEGRAP
jgi:hypothetical protein